MAEAVKRKAAQMGRSAPSGEESHGIERRGFHARLAILATVVALLVGMASSVAVAQEDDPFAAPGGGGTTSQDPFAAPEDDPFAVPEETSPAPEPGGNTQQLGGGTTVYDEFGQPLIDTAGPPMYLLVGIPALLGAMALGLFMMKFLDRVNNPRE